MIEIEDTGNQSRFVNQFNDNTDNGDLKVRRSAISLESKNLRQGVARPAEMAKDNINKDTIVIKGLDQTMHQDFYMNWSFFLRQKGFDNAKAFSASRRRFRDIGRCYSTSSSAFDCSTRRNEVRYDTPNGGASSAARRGARMTSGRRRCASRRNGTTGRSARATPMKISPTSW